MGACGFSTGHTGNTMEVVSINSLLKNAHLRRFPHPSSLRRTPKYASYLRISGALHLGIFEQSAENQIFHKLLTIQRN